MSRKRRPADDAAAKMAELTQVRDRGYQAMMSGDLDRAFRDFEDALALAREVLDQDPDAVDKAQVNLAMIRVQRHEDDLAERGLREVLLRSTNDDVIRLAAHCLAKVLSHKNEHEKALRFARLSLEKARLTDDPLRLHSALSLLGAVYGNQSYLDEALDHYEQALAILEEHPLPEPAHHAFYWAAAMDWIGYTLVLSGRHQEGRIKLEQAHERARAFGITDLVAEIGSDLCFACLQLGRLEQARMFGESALEIAESQSLDHLRRNCYYLLGETCSRLGDDEAADEHFRKLGEFYPQLPFLSEFLRQYDISAMINLKEFA
jgi:tetratricopeptide (TPR) repeat protein